MASYTLAFALQLRKKHGETSVRVDVSKNKVFILRILYKVKVKVKVHPITSHESPELYSFLNLGARWGWVVNTTPRPL